MAPDAGRPPRLAPLPDRQAPPPAGAPGPSFSADQERAAVAFSAVAPIYDRETEENRMVRLVRRRTIRRLRSLFRPGDLAIELGCGTGVEAVALAQSGVRVLATDVAPGMLAAAQARVEAAGVAGRVRLLHLGAAAVGDLLDEYGQGAFAGAYSSFGPLNCEPDLPRLAAGLHALLRPDARLVVSVINRFHPFEFAWYAAHGDLQRAVRRWGGYAEGSVSPTLPDRVPTRYYTPRAFARQFSPYFAVAHTEAVLLLLPPPYLVHLTERYPRQFGLAARLEPAIAGWPLLRGLGDHFAMELVRR